MPLSDDFIATLFDISSKVFSIKVVSGEIKGVALVSLDNKGFYIVADNGQRDILVRYVLTTTSGKMRRFKSLNTAHLALADLGVTQYVCRTSEWDRTIAYNPHLISQKSRLRKQESS